MSKPEMEASAIDPHQPAPGGAEDVQGRERRFVVAGLLCGAPLGWCGYTAVWQRFPFPSVMFGSMLGGVIGGWLYHLLHTPADRR